MVRKDGSFIKSERLQTITKQVAANIKDGVDINKTLDWVEFNLGLSRERAGEYLALIIRTHDWVRDGNIIKAEL